MNVFVVMYLPSRLVDVLERCVVQVKVVGKRMVSETKTSCWNRGDMYYSRAVSYAEATRKICVMLVTDVLVRKSGRLTSDCRQLWTCCGEVSLGPRGNCRSQV